MKIGIIVHSFSGNTYSVAQKLQEKLTSAGHSVNLEQIKLVGGEQPNNNKFQIENPPDISTYDGVVFGAPVRAFSASPVIVAYINQLSSLANKKVVCFVTKTLPFNWTGGNRAIAGMTKNCEKKGAKIAGTGIVRWTSKPYEKEIDDIVGKLSKLF